MSYFQTALLGALLIGALSGLVGVLVVLRRRTFFAQALTHGTFPGAVAAALLGVSVPLGAAVASIAIVGAVMALGRVRRQGEHVASGIVLTAGFALGVVLQSLSPQLPIDVGSFLVGSILTVTTADITLAGITLLVTVIVLLTLGKEILFSTFDRVGYRAAGFREWPIELLVLVLITATVVTAMPAVGAILAIALIAAPAAAARVLSPTVGGMFVLAPALGAASALLGVLASRAFDVAAGPAIALIAAGFFVLALGLRALRRIGWGRRSEVS